MAAWAAKRAGWLLAAVAAVHVVAWFAYGHLAGFDPGNRPGGAVVIHLAPLAAVAALSLMSRDWRRPQTRGYQALSGLTSVVFLAAWGLLLTQPPVAAESALRLLGGSALAAAVQVVIVVRTTFMRALASERSTGDSLPG